MSSFLQVLETIGKDIATGFEKAAPIIQKLSPVVDEIPMVGPALVDAATVISELEAAGSTVDAATLSQVTQSLATASAIKSASTKVKTASSTSS